MKRIKVKSQRGPYEILIGKGLIGKAGAILKEAGLGGKAMIVAQPSVSELYLKPLAASLKSKKYEIHTHLLSEGEIAKSEAELFKLLNALCDKDFERKDILIALGGGVTGDLTGFAASSYLRGIAFVNIPTTLLAQVDSAIGGKTGINLRQGKNLVGAFYPPKAVISDITALKTLPMRELHASLAEVVKYGVIRDAKLFRFLEEHYDSILAKEPASLEKIVEASSAIKAGVVTRDEHETKGERMILNFGHTFGHGFEQALHYTKLLHGEAVSIGMVCAAQLAVKLKMFSETNFVRLLEVLRHFRLPVSLKGLNVDSESVLSAMSRDRKQENFVLFCRWKSAKW
jgi:3-dehydroquinate synthase